MNARALWLRLGPLGLWLCITALCRALGGDAVTLQPERALWPPSRAHWFGLGEGGIDLLAAVGFAVQGSVALALGASALGLALGLPLGAWAGQRGGKAEQFLHFVLDVLQALPSFFVALALLAALREPSRWHLLLVFGASAWAPYARLAMAQAKVLRSAAFVEASRALGRHELAILLRHVLPQLWPLAVVQLGASAAAIVLSETGLSFLGIIAMAGPPSLGKLLDQGISSMLVAPHVLTCAALAVLLTNASLLWATAAPAHEPSAR